MQICGNVAGFVAAGLKAAALTLLLLLLLHLLPGSSLDLQFWCTYFISYLVLSSYLVPNVSDCGKATAAKHLQMLRSIGVDGGGSDPERCRLVRFPNPLSGVKSVGESD